MKIAFSALLVFLLGSAAFAQDAAEDPIHEQLRTLRSEIIVAIESRDIERMLAHVHPEVVVTWQDSTVCHGVGELRAFYEEMGKDAFVAFKVPHAPDRLSVLHGGDTAISSGHVVADYELLGKSFEFDSRWTATLVLEDGKWLLAAYQISLNALDNPILGAAKSSLWIAALAGVAIGVLGALLVVRLRRG